MRICPTSSKAVGAVGAVRAVRAVKAVGFWWLTAGPAVAAATAQTLTQDEALRLAFPPPATIERRTAFLTEEQLGRAKALAGPDVDVTSRVVTYYVGHSCGPSAPCGRSGRPLGVAYFERHRVRTLNEVLMFVVSPEGRITRLDILEFLEPPEYRASPRWLGQLLGRGLDGELSLKGAVVNLTGATLTSRAITRASRRVLALHQVIAPLKTPSP
jgi:hypothetical protein